MKVLLSLGPLRVIRTGNDRYTSVVTRVNVTMS